MNRFIFLILFVLCLPYISKGQTQRDKFIELIVSYENYAYTTSDNMYNLIIREDRFYIPCKCNNDTMKLTLPVLLSAFHKLYYKGDLSLTTFLSGIFNEKTPIDCSKRTVDDIDFKVDPKIMKMKFGRFIKKYCIKHNLNIYRIKDNVYGDTY